MTIYIVTGPKHSGKTTRLSNWCRQQSGVGGLLSPVVDGKRIFRDILSGEEFNMEAEPGEKAIQQIGRYTFSAASFNRANQVLLSAIANPEINWLVLDEIGPLELRAEGFYPALITILNQPENQKNLILVIREELIETVSNYFKLDRYPVQYLAL